MKEGDMLSEIANIGSGNAARALSKFSGKEINHLKPVINIFKDKFKYYDLFDENIEVVSSSIRFQGNFKGITVLLFPTFDAFKLIALISKKVKLKISNDLSSYKSAFDETANIFTGAYMTAISDLIKTKINHKVPELRLGHVKNVFNEISKISKNPMSKGICIKTKLGIGKENIHGYFMIFYEDKSMDKLVLSLENAIN